VKSIEEIIEQRDRRIGNIEYFLRTKFDLDEMAYESLAPTLLDLIEVNRVSLWMRAAYWLRHYYGWLLAPVIVGTVAVAGWGGYSWYYQNYYPLSFEVSKNARFPINGSCMLEKLCVAPSLVELTNDAMGDLESGQEVEINNGKGETLHFQREGKRLVITVTEQK